MTGHFPHLFQGETALFGGQLVDLPVVEGDPQALRQTAADLHAPGAELPPDGDDDLRIARGIRQIALGSGFQRPLHFGLPLHKPQQGLLEGLLEQLEHESHQHGADHRALPYPHQAAEIQERGGCGKSHHGAVEDRFHGAHGQAALPGYRQAEPLSRHGQDIGGEIEHDPRRHQGDADQQIDELQRIGARGGEKGQHAGGQVHQLPEEEGGRHLQQHGGSEIPPQHQELRQQIQAEYGGGAVAQVHEGGRSG